MILFFGVIGLVIAITNLMLGLLVLVGDLRSKINRTFFYFTLAFVIWGIGYYFALTGLNSEFVLTWSRIFMVGAILIPVLYLNFIVLFLDVFKKFKFILAIVYIFAFIFLLLNLTELFISGTTERLFFQYWMVPGPAYIIFILYFLLTIIFSIFILVNRYKAVKDISKKTQIKYIIYGSIIGLIGGSTNYFLWYNIPIPPYGNFLVISFVISISIAILKTKLFNLKIIFTEVALVLILVVASIQMFASKGLNLVISIIIFILLLVGGIFLVNFVRKEISRREEVEKLAKERSEALVQLEQRNRNLAVLQKISKVVLNEMELKPMIQKILDEIPQQLESTLGAMLCLVRGGRLRAYAISNISVSKKIVDLIGTDDLEKISDPIKKGHNKMHDTFFVREFKESDSLADFISPPISRTNAIAIERLIGVKHVIALPLLTGHEPLGVLLLTYKSSKNQLEPRELEMAQSIADDITLAVQRAEAFEKLRDANAHLNELDKMKNEFISMASHELNTPLAAVEGYLSMILDENMGKVDSQAREYLSRAYASSKRLAEMILDLLNVSRIEQGKLKMSFTLSNISELAESVVEELQVKANAKKLRLELLSEKSPEFSTFCDADRIREVIVNLVANAIKYTDQGEIKVEVAKNSEHIVVKISDTGRGIAEEDLSKLFQKFSQVNRSQDEHQGTGLGLYISKNFVELHKGRIWVESRVGEGSDFAFEIPMLKKAPEKVEGAILESVSLLSKGKKN